MSGTGTQNGGSLNSEEGFLHAIEEIRTTIGIVANDVRDLREELRDNEAKRRKADEDRDEILDRLATNQRLISLRLGLTDRTPSNPEPAPMDPALRRLLDLNLRREESELEREARRRKADEEEEHAKLAERRAIRAKLLRWGERALIVVGPLATAALMKWCGSS